MVGGWELPTMWAGYRENIPWYQEGERPAEFFRAAISQMEDFQSIHS